MDPLLLKPCRQWSPVRGVGFGVDDGGGKAVSFVTATRLRRFAFFFAFARAIDSGELVGGVEMLRCRPKVVGCPQRRSRRRPSWPR